MEEGFFVKAQITKKGSHRGHRVHRDKKIKYFL